MRETMELSTAFRDHWMSRRGGRRGRQGGAGGRHYDVKIYAPHRDGASPGESGKTDLGWHLKPHRTPRASPWPSPDAMVRFLEGLAHLRGLLRCGA